MDMQQNAHRIFFDYDSSLCTNGDWIFKQNNLWLLYNRYVDTLFLDFKLKITLIRLRIRLIVHKIKKKYKNWLTFR